MPATFAHPAFSVPFARFGLPVSALVTGAMAPDLAYLLPVWSVYTGHTLLGVFCFGGPTGLLAWALFHTIVRPGLWPLAPRPWQVALAPWTTPVDLRSPRAWAIALFAATLGAATHVGIDELTHAYGWAAQTWPEVWAAPRWSTPVGPIAIYKALQYGLGVLGTAALAAWTLRAYRSGRRRGPPTPWTPSDRRRRARLLLALAVTAGLAGLIGAYAGAQHAGLRGLKVFAVNTAAAGLVLAMVQAVLLGAWGLRARRSSPA